MNELDPFFLGLWRKEYLVPNMTRMELSSSKYDAKNWTFEYDSNFFSKEKTTHRIQPLFFEYDQRIGLFLLNMTQRIEPFIFLNMTHRIKPFIFKSVSNWTFSKNWTLYFWLDSKYWIFFLSTAQWIEPCFLWLEEFFFKKKRLKELSFFLKKNQTWLKELEFFTITSRFENDSNNWTLFFLVWLFFFKNWLSELNFFSNVTLKIEPFFFRTLLEELNPSLKELNFFSKFDCENWTPSLIRLKNWLEKFDWWFCFCKYDKSNWFFFWIWLNELNFFFSYDSKHSTFVFKMTLRTELFFRYVPKKLNFFLHMAQRIEFLYLTQGIEPFSISTERIELFAIWPKQLNLFSSDSKNWNFFKIRLTELNLLKKYDSQKWTFFDYDSQKLTIFL